MRDHVVIYLNGKRLAIAGDDVFSRWWSSFASAGWSVPRSAVGREIAGRARSWPAPPKMGQFAIGRSCRASGRFISLMGCTFVTIEGVAHRGTLSPVQQAMVDCHGSQCGFCTPGFVNSLTGVFECDGPVDEDALRASLAGNLCRCTGYEPILAAGRAVDPAKVRRLSSLYPSRVMVDELTACANAPI